MAASSSSIEEIFAEKLDISNDFPFLNDQNTIDFIKNAKIMFINRGIMPEYKVFLWIKLKATICKKFKACPVAVNQHCPKK